MFFFLRHNGGKIADFHRILLFGGILIFAQKEVCIFEAFILTYIIEKAWNKSSSGLET